MTRQELERWLCGSGALLPTPAEIAAVLGVAFETIEDTPLLRVANRLSRVRFTIAVLRDVFADDQGVRWWLRLPRAEWRGRSALDLLLRGQTQPVEELALREWHWPSGVVAGSADLGSAGLARTA
jgi:hypothetical protein